MSVSRRFPHDRSKRKGFTLIELLVVITIIAVLASMLLGAVNMVRGAALKASCSNNEKNLMLAMVNFSSNTSSGKLPGEKAKMIGRWSLWAEILPQLDQKVLFDRLNFRTASPTVLQIQSTGNALKDVKDWTFGTGTENSMSTANGQPGPHVIVVMTKVPSFYCPSDQTATICTSAINYTPLVSAKGAMEGSSSGTNIPSVWEADNETQFPLTSTAPATTFTSRVNASKLDSMNDGLTTTIGFSERLKGRMASGRADKKRNQAATGSSDSSFIVVDGVITTDNTQMVNQCKQATGAADPANDMSGSLWLQHTCQWMGCSNLMGPPNSVPCKGSTAQTNLAYTGIAAPSSNHSGGVNAAYFDGHVEFLSDTTDLKILHALSTPNGGESTVEAP